MVCDSAQLRRRWTVCDRQLPSEAGHEPRRAGWLCLDCGALLTPAGLWYPCERRSWERGDSAEGSLVQPPLCHLWSLEVTAAPPPPPASVVVQSPGGVASRRHRWWMRRDGDVPLGTDGRSGDRGGKVRAERGRKRRRPLVTRRVKGALLPGTKSAGWRPPVWLSELPGQPRGVCPLSSQTGYVGSCLSAATDCGPSVDACRLTCGGPQTAKCRPRPPSPRHLPLPAGRHPRGRGAPYNQRWRPDPAPAVTCLGYFPCRHFPICYCFSRDSGIFATLL